MKKVAKIALLSLVASSFLLSSCAKRHACNQPAAVPSYVQTGK